MIAEIDPTFLRQDCTEAINKDNNRGQELTGKEDREERVRASAGEEGETVLNNAVNYSQSRA